jgi:hypothetical protein
LTPQRTISPTWRRRTPETPSESPLPAIVPDLLLARTDSCKTNTDVSESTTTDDYITANSGTDSSRKSGSTKVVAGIAVSCIDLTVGGSQGVDLYNLHAHHQDGSSFESNKGDIFGDDMVVPSFSPPLILEEAHTLSNTPVPEVRTGRSTPSTRAPPAEATALTDPVPICSKDPKCLQPPNPLRKTRGARGTNLPFTTNRQSTRGQNASGTSPNPRSNLDFCAVSDGRMTTSVANPNPPNADPSLSTSTNTKTPTPSHPTASTRLTRRRRNRRRRARSPRGPSREREVQCKRTKNITKSRNPPRSTEE